MLAALGVSTQVAGKTAPAEEADTGAPASGSKDINRDIQARLDHWHAELYGKGGDIPKFQEALKRMDSDGDGRVSKSEFMKEYLSGVSSSSDVDATSFVEDIFAKADVNNDGELDIDEISGLGNAFMGSLEKAAYQATIFNMIYKSMDANGDGSIGMAEMIDMAASSSEFTDENSTVRQMLKHFAEADADGDKTLSKEEAAVLAKEVFHNGEV